MKATALKEGSNHLVYINTLFSNLYFFSRPNREVAPLPKTPTTLSGGGARPKVPQSLVSSSNARQRLVPNPDLKSLPQKSAAISQTIQHFANLQRENNLRRSSQQLSNSTNQQKTPTLPTVAPPPPPPTKSHVTRDSTHLHSLQSHPVQTNSDYDYIGGMKPTLVANNNINTKRTSCTTPPPPALPVSKPKQASPGVGNPLYSSVPPPLHYLQQQQDNWEALNADTTSALDREYARLFGDKIPSQIKSTKQVSDEFPSESSESSSSSSSENASEGSNSLPPPRGSPPPLPQHQASSTAQKTSPPIVRNVQLKSEGSGEGDVKGNRLSSTQVVNSSIANNNSTWLSDDNNNSIDESTSLSLVSMSSNSSFASGKLTSPKMVRRNKTAGKQHSGLQSPTLSIANQQPSCKSFLPFCLNRYYYLQ